MVASSVWNFFNKQIRGFLIKSKVCHDVDADG